MVKGFALGYTLSGWECNTIIYIIAYTSRHILCNNDCFSGETYRVLIDYHAGNHMFDFACVYIKSNVKIILIVNNYLYIKCLLRKSTYFKPNLVKWPFRSIDVNEHTYVHTYMRVGSIFFDNQFFSLIFFTTL